MTDIRKNRYAHFLITKFMIAVCFGGMLLFDFAVVVLLLNLMGIISNYIPENLKTNGYGYFIAQLSGAGGVILYIIFYIISLLASASLMRQEIKDILSDNKGDVS